MRAARLGLLVLIAVTTAPQVVAAQTEVTAYQRFELFNNCRPMWLMVWYPLRGPADFLSTIERLKFAAESRLRGARLYESTMSVPVLYVRVGAVGRAYHVALEYHKQVVDVATDEAYSARTWHVGGTGIGDVDSIVSTLTGFLDQFLTEYLRVNEEACER